MLSLQSMSLVCALSVPVTGSECGVRGDWSSLIARRKTEGRVLIEGSFYAALNYPRSGQCHGPDIGRELIASQGYQVAVVG